MSQFSYSDYQDTISKAQSKDSANSSVKVGYFKLPKDGDAALVRINLRAIEDLKFATVHKPNFGKKFEGLGTGFTPVSCLNEVGSYSDACPFCKAAAEGHEVVGKAVKNAYVEMMVAYQDPQTGGWLPAVPVVWERPAGFSRELSTKIKDNGPLTDLIFKITRFGTGKDTRYSVDYVRVLDKPEFVPNDFSAFENFNINKHSYWEKTAEELETYLATGSFPQPEPKPAQESKNLEKVIPTKEEERKVEEALGFRPETEPVVTPPVQPTTTTTTTETKSEDRPIVRKFDGLSF